MRPRAWGLALALASAATFGVSGILAAALLACARALVSRPSIVFADEPTGNLDSRTTEEVLDFLRLSVDEFGQTVVIVTHDPRAAAHADRVVFLDEGAIAADASVTTTTLIAHPLHRAARAAPAAPPARASRTTSGSRRCY